MKIAVDARRVALQPGSSHCRYLAGMLPHWQQDERVREMILVMPWNARDVALPDEVTQLSKVRLEYGDRCPRLRSAIPYELMYQQWAVPKVIRRTRPDVFLSSFHMCPFVTWGVPVVTTIHDLCPLHEPTPTRERFVWREFHRLQFQTACLKSRRLICVSKSTAAALRQYAPTTSERIRMVYNGFDAPPAEADSSTTEGNLLWVGEAGYRKNPELAFATFSELLKDRPQLKMVAIVPAHVVEEMRALAVSVRVDQAVEFRSHLTDAELDSAYRCAGALIVPSRCEGFGYPLLEAMSRGLPAVGYRKTPALEIVGSCYPLPDSLDAQEFARTLGTLIDLRGAERLAMSTTLIARAGMFSTERMARETITVLADAANA